MQVNNSSRPKQTPSGRAAGRRLRSALCAAIDALPMKERLVVSLHYGEELTLGEIGKILALREALVSRLHAVAVRKLRACARGTFRAGFRLQARGIAS